MPSLKPQIADFFRASKDADRFIFTTFSLDEQIFASLLKAYNVAEGCRVIVFHDVMRHRQPGFLRQHYENSLIVSVCLKANGAQAVPVFHGKLWLAMNGNECIALAAPSLNLTRYHLGDSFKTFDSFPWWSKLKLSKEFIKMLNEYVPKKKGLIRCEMKAQTVVIDARNKAPEATLRSNPAVKIIKEAIGSKVPTGLAAPFVSKTAVKELCGQDESSTIWKDCKKRPPTALHAKIIEAGEVMTIGSVNLTSQALGINGIVNHEVVVIGRRGNITLKDLLKGFPQLKKNELVDGDEPPGDPDETDEIENWGELRRRALNGPTAVCLKLKNKKPRIEFVGKLGRVGCIEVVSKSAGRGGNLKLKMSSRNRFRFLQVPKSQNYALLDCLLNAPVMVRGLWRNKVVWERELDFGALWQLLEQRSFRKFFESAVGESTVSSDPGARGEGATRFSDVRDARNEALCLGDVTPRSENHEVRAWREWFQKTASSGQADFPPEWCATLARDLHSLSHKKEQARA